MSSTSSVPARNRAQLLLQSVHAPTRTPWKLPGIMGPVTRWIRGLLAEMPPMSWAGVVLSQPENHVTDSLCSMISHDSYLR
jgi:hypothetical protein